MRLIDTLRDHCTYNCDAQKKLLFFPRILGTIPELRTLSKEGLQRLNYFKVAPEGEMAEPPPPTIQTLFLGNHLPF